MTSDSGPNSNKLVDPQIDDEDDKLDEPWKKEFAKDIEKLKKERPGLCFEQGADPDCPGPAPWCKYHADPAFIRGPGKQYTPETQLDEWKEYERNPAAMNKKGYCKLGKELARLDYALQKTLLRPNPIIQCKGVYEDENGEDGMSFAYWTTARGGPNITSRGGGLRAYRFGQANREGITLMANKTVVTRRKDRPSKRTTKIRARSPVLMTDAELRQFRRDSLDKANIKWT